MPQRQLVLTMQRVDTAHERLALPIRVADCALPEHQLQDDERHNLQRGSLIDTLRREGLASPSLSIVEFGAGDAALSRECWRRGTAGRFCVVERNPKRAAQLERARSVGGTPAGFMPSVLCADVCDLEPDELRGAVESGRGSNVMLCNREQRLRAAPRAVSPPQNDARARTRPMRQPRAFAPRRPVRPRAR